MKPNLVFKKSIEQNSHLVELESGLTPYGAICLCKEEKKKEKAETKKRKKKKKVESPFSYDLTLDKVQSFRIQYDSNLSLLSKSILNSFQNKYIYHAINDILHLLDSIPTERDKLLAILYSPMISLQNDFSINFFDIWIHQIHIEEVFKPNKFLRAKSNIKTLAETTYITIELLYKETPPKKEKEVLW